MKKKSISIAMAVTVSAAVLAGCGSSSSDTASTTAATEAATAAATEAAASADTEAAADTTESSASSEGGTLTLSTFGLSEDISEDEVYKPFEDEYGCDIVTETGGASDRYTKFSSNPDSSIDVIELSQATAAKGVDAGLFETVDTSKLSNYEDLIDSAKTFVEAGNPIPYTLNSIGIIYDEEAVGHELTSFDDLWDSGLADSIAIPDITTTFGPAMVYVAGEHAGTDVTEDNGEAAFQALEELKPNIVKSYTKSSDLINMFTSGEIIAAVVGDFGVPTIVEANPNLTYVTPDGTYANFNVVAINKNSENKDLAYEYVDYRISEELQTTTCSALNEAPTNKNVTYTDEQAATITVGDKAANAKFVDYSFVNPILDDWIDQWNRTINS